MNKRSGFFLIILTCFLFVSTTGCKKDDKEPKQTTVTDIDGNVYHTVKIGGQTWMVENLKTTKYRNGDPIANVNGDQWDKTISGAYCLYDNSAANVTTYGLLYNWHAVNDPRKIAPEGWHVATLQDWETLAASGLELKESGTTHWISPNNCGSTDSGFKGLPGGNCGYDGNFNALTEGGYWWTADEENAQNSWAAIMTNINPGLSGFGNPDKWLGASVRCVKD